MNHWESHKSSGGKKQSLMLQQVTHAVKFLWCWEELRVLRVGRHYD